MFPWFCHIQYAAFIFAVATSVIEGIHVPSLPTPTSTFATSATQIAPFLPGPTPPPGVRLVRRQDVEDSLRQYEHWAKICNDDDITLQQVPINDNASIRALWRTVTETVYCGHGHVRTITKTMTATATVAASTNKPDRVICNDECWSNYLWHTYGYGISVAQGFTGMMSICVGLYFMLFGYRFFRPTLGLVGFVLFVSMTWIGLTNNEPIAGYPHAEVLYVSVCLGLGLVGACMFICCYPLALYFIGGLGGLFFGIFFLAWQQQFVVHVKIARLCLVIGSSIVGAILVYLLESYAVIFATSFMGAYLFILGLDFFIHTGFVNAWLLLFDGNPNRTYVYILSRPVYAMLSCVAVLALVFTGWQFVWNIAINGRHFGINAVPAKPEADSDEKPESITDAPDYHPCSCHSNPIPWPPMISYPVASPCQCHPVCDNKK